MNAMKTPHFEVMLSHIENEVYNLTQWQEDEGEYPDCKLVINGLTMYFYSITDITITPVHELNIIYFNIVQKYSSNQNVGTPIKINVKKLKEFRLIGADMMLEEYITWHTPRERRIL